MNVKQCNGSTELSCQRCKVPRAQLGNPAYDFRKNSRSAEGVDRDIEYVKKGATATERTTRGRDRGVVPPRVPNPLKKLTFDRQLQIPFDIFHLDALVRAEREGSEIENVDCVEMRRCTSGATDPPLLISPPTLAYRKRCRPPFNLTQNKSKRMIRFVLSACDVGGLAVVSARVSLRQLLPPNISPMGDITTDAGWAGLTGNQIWILSSILPLLFAPIFADVNSMVCAFGTRRAGKR